MWRSLSNVLGGHPPLSIDASLPPEVPEPTADPVPDVVGISLIEARRLARLVGQRVFTVEQATSHGLWGRVLEQTPAPGLCAAADAILVLTVGARPHVIVPDVRGRDEDDALSMLREVGLGTARRAARRSDVVPEGHIVRTRPRAGAEVPSGSLVSYVVAVGPRTTRLPPRGERGRTRVLRLHDGSIGRKPER